MNYKENNDHLIPSADPRLRFSKYNQEISAAIQNVLQSGSYILGNELIRFEREFADYIGADHCIGVNSCTDSLTLCLKAENIGQGDEVITTGLTAPATAIAILNTEATPVIVDIEKNSFNISIEEIQNSITKNTKAIIPVHLHGKPCNLEAVSKLAEKHNLVVIEDCAQAHGATINNQKVGSIGDYGVFSFYPTKNLGCMGDAGAITTNSSSKAEKVKSLHNYGFDDKGQIINAGLNSRMDEIQAAILNVLLPHLDEYNESRKQYALKYALDLNAEKFHFHPFDNNSVYHQFVIQVKNRDEIRNRLLNEGIQTAIHYNKPLVDHPALAPFCKQLPNAKIASESMISLPIQPEILSLHYQTIIETLNRIG